MLFKEDKANPEDIRHTRKAADSLIDPKGCPMKIRKAEAHERKNYSGLYPLFGYVIGVPATVAGIKTRYNVPVEGLFEGKDEPNYEAMLPDGLHLSGEMIHSVLGTTQRDLLDRLAAGLEECDADYDCKVQTGPRENA